MTTVAVVGLGDLGGRVLGALAASPRVGRLVGASRDAERGRGLAGQAQLVAALRGGPRHVEFAACDLADVEATALLLRRLEPEVVVVAAARHTWRHSVAGVPYAVWLPLLLPLVRDLVRARDEAGVAARIVCLPYPDAVGPALAPLGLAPDVGAGNVGETAPKLALLADPGAEVRLVMHHAAQRHAFPAFGGLGGDGEPEPPWAAEVLVGGEPLARERVEELFRAPWPLARGAALHDLTAAATVQVVEALVSDEPVRLHAPAPAGRPGGYPLAVSRAGLELDLPRAVGEAEAVALNERAARWDGLERVEPDGTVVFTDAAAAAAERLLGVRLGRLAPSEWGAAAGELERARERAR